MASINLGSVPSLSPHPVHLLLCHLRFRWKTTLSRSSMTSKFVLLSFAFIFLMCCVLEMEINLPISDCSGGENGCISPTASGAKETHNRKFLSMDSERYYGVVGNGGGTKMVESEWEREMMRWVPSGPDPLHHNGAYPKKPRSP